MDLRDRFGIRLKTARRALGLTQDDLADRIERSVFTVSKLERGETLPNAETLLRIADALSLQIGELFTADDSNQDPEREELLARLHQAVRNMKTSTLSVAVAQMEAMARLRD